MKLLHSKNVLECNEKELELHHQETEQILEKLGSINNYDVDIQVKRVDYIGKHLTRENYKHRIHEIDQFVSCFDIKNGVDIYISKEHLVIHTFGFAYEVFDKTEQILHAGHVQSEIEISAKSDQGELDFSKLFEEVKQNREMEMSM